VSGLGFLVAALPAALPAALLAGLSSALWVGSPARELALRGASTDDLAPHRRRTLLTARPDAPPLARRLLVSLTAAGAIALAVVRLSGGPAVLGVLLLPVLTLLGVLVLGRLEPADARRRQEQLVLQLPQALELLSACLTAGMPLRQATRAVSAAFDGALQEDLSQVLRLVDLGISDAEAWRSLRTHARWGPAAVDLARSVESGTMMVEVLVHHAGAARELRRAALEVRAKSVGVRSVLPLMTCFLPAFLLLGVIPTVASAVVSALS
jgi:pilus assembly protein TadC